MRIRNSGRAVAALTVIVGVLLLAPLVSSLPTGIGGSSIQTAGCNCHNGLSDSSVVADIQGFPEQYNASETYSLSISFTGGPAQEGNVNLGGFNLWASDGVFTPTDGLTQLWGGSVTEVAHTEAGNDYTSWVLDWTAPESGKDVDFILHVNSVNGDGVQTGQIDQWNRADYTLQSSFGVIGEVIPDAPEPFVVLATLILITLALVAVTILYGFYRSDPDGFSWETFSPWIVEWLTTTDHKRIGTLYFLAGLFFLGIGGIMALFIRVQLATPGNDFLTQDQYNQFFTLHGTTMIFLAAMPLINGFANWMVPLQIGAPDLAMPRLNAMSFWLQPVGSLGCSPDRGQIQDGLGMLLMS